MQFLKQEDADSSSTAQWVRTFLDRQLQTWPLASQNFAALSEVRIRELRVEELRFQLQFNPARLRSATAQVDPASIAQRRCFLCEASLPAEQIRVELPGDFRLLVNPYPILPVHFTVPSVAHVPQRLGPSLGHCLRLTKQLGESFVAFYNGPKCGASAPDHLHFQVVPAEPLQLWRDLDRFHVARQSLTETITALATSLRPLLLIESPSLEQIQADFQRCERAVAVALRMTGDDEPLINALCRYRRNVWQLCLIPRTAHRPRCYFVADPQRRVLSPASVDLAGLCVVARESDFEVVTDHDLHDMLQDVCPLPLQFQEILAEILRGGAC